MDDTEGGLIEVCRMGISGMATSYPGNNVYASYFHFFPTLLSQFHFRVSSNPRHVNLILLPKCSGSFFRSFLFQFAIAWNNLSVETRSIVPNSAFSRQIRIDYQRFRYSLDGVKLLFD